MKTRCDIAGFVVRRTRTEIVIRFLNYRLRKNLRAIVFYANSNFVIQCKHLRQAILGSSELFVLNDGVALNAASILLYGTPFPENLNGSDFTVALLAGLEQPTRVFLLGARPSVVESAAKKLNALANVEIAGTLDGYSIWENEAAIIDKINQSKSDILLIALGNPLQEEWILRHRNQLNATLLLGVGALFDFISGHKPRAPKALQAMNLEWAHRLALDPRRLVARYTIEMVRFFLAVISASRTRRRS